MKIKNKNYRKFLDEGIIDPITEEQINQALRNVRGRHSREGRALLITLYYTGARPNEVLRIQGKDVSRQDQYIIVKVKGSKGGLPRTLYFPYKKALLRELYTYATGRFPEMYLFYHFQNKYVRTVPGKTGPKQNTTITDKLRYHLNKWFEGVIEDSINPYFLRHNRFSKLAEAGLSMQDLRMIKGSRTTESVTPYLHMSAASAKKAAKKME